MYNRTYEETVLEEALRFERSLQKKSSIIQRKSKKVQTKINDKIPEKVHRIVTDSIKGMIQTALTTSTYIYPIKVEETWTLQERERRIMDRLKKYKNTAAMEGAGTGAGGFWLSMADFPLLLSIKMKFLFDTAQIYGLNVKTYEERVFLLYVFLLAFSSDTKRREVVGKIKAWEKEKSKWGEQDWKTLQLEYRDTLDFVKVLQMIPGFGAVVGFFANAKLLEQLGETALNAYRIRLLS
ncbi:EcsC family protein [Terrihalobacillus insolitus]|uniref:EcsC family protein n=1 Tax=Terrihalobacillus insolitus TaxID=2950438 RepID=UPI002340C9A7|nr:EcsC family protein [Terrihalobacillus insolitus]MDC3413755.1 EcsC family protein [Terrihalobacillus insolitus]